ncbi:hypothetical protein HNR10_000331 [Nocardiopsis aegyptia]|uniref:Uncharacterized protein n=1 Tax=Nocardiopsis aegyptia TaxID=220378 RepID=A0A7Z0EI12_9ACTN|nr:hypothetical protein [Nocardiopsis aegyptia]
MVPVPAMTGVGGVTRVPMVTIVTHVNGVTVVVLMAGVLVAVRAVVVCVVSVFWGVRLHTAECIPLGGIRQARVR